MDVDSQSFPSGSEYESDASESSRASTPPPPPRTRRISKKTKSVPKSKSKQIEEGFEEVKKRPSKRNKDLETEENETKTKPSKKKKNEHVSNVVKVDFSEKRTEKQEIPEFQGYIGEKWYLKLSHYSGRQWFCLRQYEDKNFTKAPKGNE